MAVAVYVSDLAAITNYVPTFGGSWGAGGGGGAALTVGDTDAFIIGSECVSKGAYASDDKWIYGPTSSQTLATDAVFYMWGTHLVANEIAAKASGGFYFTIGSSSTANHEYWAAGGDTLIYDDRWICSPIDPRNAEALWSATNGSPSTTVFSVFGVGADLPAGGPTKGSPLCFGGLRKGREFTVTLGDGTAYGTFAGAATWNDALARRYGQFQLSGGGYKMQCLFNFGSTGTAVDFRDANKSVSIANTEFVVPGFNGFEVNNVSSKVLLEGVTIRALGTQSPGYWLNNHDADVDLLGCTFIGMGDFDFLAATVATDCLWQNCGQVTPVGADLSRSTFEGYEGAADSAAVVWNETADPDTDMTDMSFTKGTAATHAIEFGTSAPTTMTLDGVTFAGYSTTAAPGDNSSALNFLRTSGTTTLNVVGGTTDISSSIKTTGSHEVNVVSSVPVTINVKDVTDQSAVSGAYVHVEAASGGDLPYQDVVTITTVLTVATVTHTAHGLKSGELVKIRGANEPELNLTATVTVLTVNTYIYTIVSIGATASGTGTITATGVIIHEDTNGSGVADNPTFRYTTNQPISGVVRQGDVAPFYQQGIVVGTITANGFDVNVFLVRDS